MLTLLHVRSGYSLTRGTAMPQRLVELAAGLGYAQLALTDVNGVYGLPQFYKQAQGAGLRPLVGAQLCEGDLSLLALVENDAGYENLCQIITAIHKRAEGAEGRHGTRIGSSLQADLSRFQCGLHFVVEDADAAGRLAGVVDRTRLWLGLDAPTQRHSQVRSLVDCARKLDLPLVATGKAMVGQPVEMELARLLAAIRLGKTYETVVAGDLPHEAAYLRPPADLARQHAEFPDALANNERLASLCAEYKFLPRRPVFPDFDCPDGLAAAQYLRRLCDDGLANRYGDGESQAARTRVAKELALIERMGFCEYFLVVWDIVRYARSRGAPVAGRGSGASSIVAYILGITNVCPIEYDIPFERFIHEGREDFPDLDVDFCWRIRDDVIDYAFKRWGGDRVAMVCMHNTFQPRSAIRETAKAFGYSNDQISRLDEASENGDGSDKQEGRNSRDGLGRILALSRRLVGLPHNLSVHPGGIVIGRLPIDHYVPVQTAAKGVTITQYDKDGIEDIRLVKLDLLGNRNLSTIRGACDLIRRGRGLKLDVETLPDNDAATIEVLQKADTLGCNQIESPAMRSLLRMLRPQSAADVMKALALIRPGAASIGMKETFIRRRLGLEPAPSGPAPVEALLGGTYGVMLYEDDVMLVAAAMIGGSLGQADRFRKAVQKCRDDAQRIELSRQFLSACQANGIDLEYAKGMWIQMAKFNAYSFCRAHAASYARLAYAGAYLKTHYPLEFWTAALNNNQSMYHPRVYVDQAKRDGVRFLLPDVNRSEAEFAVDDGAIRVGLNLVAGLGPVAVAEIVRQRSRWPFDCLSDFMLRTGICDEGGRSLVLCGAFDWTGRTRPTLMMELNLFGKIGPRRGERDRVPLLAAVPTIPNIPTDYTPMRKYFDQRRILGVSVGQHIMSLYRRGLAEVARLDADSRQIPNRVGRTIRLAGVLEAVRTTNVERGGAMMFLTLQDEWGVFEVTVFPDVLRRMEQSFTRYGPYIVSGKVDEQYGAITIAADRVTIAECSADNMDAERTMGDRYENVPPFARAPM